MKFHTGQVCVIKGLVAGYKRPDEVALYRGLKVTLLYRTENFSVHFGVRWYFKAHAVPDNPPLWLADFTRGSLWIQESSLRSNGFGDWIRRIENGDAIKSKAPKSPRKNPSGRPRDTLDVGEPYRGLSEIRF